MGYQYIGKKYHCSATTTTVIQERTYKVINKNLNNDSWNDFKTTSNREVK